MSDDNYAALSRPAGNASDPSALTANEVSRKVFRQLVGLLPEAGLLLASDGPLASNERFTELLGYSPHDLAGRALTDLLQTGTADIVREAVAPSRAAAWRGPRRCRDGTTLYLEIFALPLSFTPEAEIWLALYREEEADGGCNVQAEAERLKLALKSANAWCWEWDIRRDQMERSSELFEAHGVPSSSLGSTLNGVLERMHPDDRGRALELVNRAIRDRGEYDNVVRLCWIDGSSRWIASRGRAIYDDSGAPVRMIGVATDVTEQRRAEEALRNSEESFRSMIENAPYGIYRSTPGGRFLSANPALVRMLGYGSAKELLDLDMARDVYENAQERSGLLASLATAQSFSGVETCWKRKDGSPISVRLSGRQLRDGNDNLACFEVFAEDITEQRVLQEQFLQAQKMEAMGQLAGGVAHDFNNLLTIILGYSALLQEQWQGDDARRGFLDRIQNAANRASSLTRQLLTFSRKRPQQEEIVDCNVLLTELGKMLPPLIGENIEVHIVPGREPLLVRADSGRIGQVIVNLAVNARDAMPSGGTLKIRGTRLHDQSIARNREPRSHAAGWVEIAVEDTGCGMTAETVARMFEPFFTTKEPGKGTGLGLSTVYGIVHQAGGEVIAESELGSGSRFRVLLPAAGALENPQEIERLLDESLHGRETILLVEDEDGLRELVERCLRSLGYTVLAAKDGLMALDVVQAYDSPIDLLILDLVLPRMNAGDVSAWVLERYPKAKLLLVSGYDAQEQARAVAPSVLLQKPFSPRVLACAVRRVIESKSHSGGSSPDAS